MEFLFDCLFDFSLTHEWENRTLTSKNLYHIFLLIKNALDYPFFSHQRMGSEKKFIKIYIYVYISFRAHPWWRIFHCHHERQSKSDACPRRGGLKLWFFYFSLTHEWENRILTSRNLYHVCLLIKNHLDYPFFSFLYIFFPSPSLMAHFSLPPWTTIKKWCVST